MYWSFALVNHRLAEIYFEKKKGVVKYIGHALVKKSEYKSKQEQNWIAKETARTRLTYKNEKYSTQPGTTSQ